MNNPEIPQLSEYEQLQNNRRQAALAVVKKYKVSSRGFNALQRDAESAKAQSKPRFRGWMVQTYALAVELWNEEASTGDHKERVRYVFNRQPKPKPEPKPTIPRPEMPIPALPLGKVSEILSPASSSEIFSARRKAQIERELSGEIDIAPPATKVLPKVEQFKEVPLGFTHDDIVVTERTPGVFGQVFQHPFNHSPKVFREDRQPRPSHKFKKA